VHGQLLAQLQELVVLELALQDYHYHDLAREVADCQAIPV